MPPFASAELARDSPLDELAVRHSASSVSIASAASSTRPNSLSILDAFPLPQSPELTQEFRTDNPGALCTQASVPANSAFRSTVPHHGQHGRAAPAESAPRSQTIQGSFFANSGSDLTGPSLHEQPSLSEEAGQWSPGPGLADGSGSNKDSHSKHSRASSVETIQPAPEHPVGTSPVSLSRTQKRYMRYGHNYSGSQSHVSPSLSPEKPVPPALWPTWRSLGLPANSAPNSAVSPGASPLPKHAHLVPPMAESSANNTHTRAPSQPNLAGAHSAAPRPANSLSATSGSPTKVASGSPSPFRLRPSKPTAFSEAPTSLSHTLTPPIISPTHTHGSSQSWDVSSTMRIRVPTLSNAAQHLREGSSLLPLDPRVTLEHWAAAASRFGSAAGNLLLELGWAERWIPWTLISGLNLPVNLHEVDLAELKYGVEPCQGRVADALHSYGVRLRVRQQETAALRAFELAQSLGSADAAVSAAHLCMKGGRHVKKDVVRARHLLRRVNDI